MHALAPLIISGLVIAFVLYRRARAHIGRQLLRPIRFKVRMGILIALTIAIVVFGHPPLIPALAGLAGGIVLAVFSLKHTHFERDGERVFYTPNIYIGLGITALFIGRVVYRYAAQMDTIRAAQAAHQAPRPDFASTMGNPTTIGIFLIVVGYYVVYYAGILRTAGKIFVSLGPGTETPHAAAAPSDGSTPLR